MNEQERAKAGIAVCNDLLRRELAAVEVYRLAAALLESGLGTPDYEALRSGHQGQVDWLEGRIREWGAEPQPLENSWDRPRTAVLCAATLYGYEEPQGRLREMEEEVVATYRNVADAPQLDPSLREALQDALLPTARSLLAVVQTGADVSAARADELGSEEPVYARAGSGAAVDEGAA